MELEAVHPEFIGVRRDVISDGLSENTMDQKVKRRRDIAQTEYNNRSMENWGLWVNQSKSPRPITCVTCHVIGDGN